MLWIIFAAMTTAVLALILVPLWRQIGETADGSAYDVAVYRDQLGELDRDLESGLIHSDEAEAARAEIGRRLLAANEAVERDDKPTSAKERRIWITGGLLLAIPAMAFATYELLGAPEVSGSPAVERQAAASRLSSQDHQKMIHSMVARLAERLAATPDDADGWIRLGRSYRVLGEATKSRAAYAKAASLRPNDISVLSSYIASITDVEGADATKQPEFIDTVAKILSHDPNNHTALWFSGLRARQLGDQVKAAEQWRKLLGLLDAGSEEHSELSWRLRELETGQ